MFHKRDDRLRRLNEELLAEEEDYEEEYEEEYGEEELDLAQLEEILDDADLEDCFEEEEEDEPLYRNFANRYGRGSQKTFDDDFDYDDGDFEDEEVLYRSDYKKAKRKKRRKNFGLVLLLILELIAIAAVALWWLSWIL